MEIRPFAIEVAPETLADLRNRLAATRWPAALDDPKSQLGIENATVKHWCERWRDFGWGKRQAELNAFDQFIARIDGIDLHFVHVRSASPGATPLLLMNGWPSTFAELTKLIEPLTSGDPAFHVVIPSLPGFGFSGQPQEPGWNLSRMAKAMSELMTGLGYGRFAVHGGDMGGGVMLALADQIPERLIFLHSINVYWGYPKPNDLSREEREWYEAGEQWQKVEGGYAMIQASKPQTLAVAVNDSPAGLAAWILEKWQGWSDRGLDAFAADDILTNLTIYWATGTIGSSMRLYFETVRDPDVGRWARRHEVPAGALVLPGDILPAPRAWGERWYKLVQWTEAKSGGHFAALDSGDLLADELRAMLGAADGGQDAALIHPSMMDA